MAEEKTEQATHKKLQKAREEGQVARSADLVEASCLAVMVLVFHAGGNYLGDSLRAAVQEALGFVSGDHSISNMMATLNHIARAALGLMLPIALASVAAALFTLAPQTGLTITMTPIVPKFEAVSPASGFQRIYSMKAVVDLAKMVAKALVLVAVMWKTIEWLLPLIASSLYQPVPVLVNIMWSVLLKLLDVATAVYLVIGFIDFGLQKWMFGRQNKMSKDEVKREHKEQEGDPKIKGERRRLAQEMVMNAPEVGMSRANMLVVNPTHYAVAVRYQQGETPLPIIVARGVDEEAARLRRLAFEHGVPIVANPPVARALHVVPLGQPVPDELLEVVAAILRWVESVGAQRSAAQRSA